MKRENLEIRFVFIFMLFQWYFDRISFDGIDTYAND